MLEVVGSFKGLTDVDSCQKPILTHPHPLNPDDLQALTLRLNAKKLIAVIRIYYEKWSPVPLKRCYATDKTRNEAMVTDFGGQKILTHKLIDLHRA